MLRTEILEPSVGALAATLTGDVVSPADPGWDLARRAWNLAVDQRPVLVAVPADAADVIAVTAFARRHGLKLAPQGTQRVRGVEIDHAAETARVQAGTLWLEVSEASTPHGLFPLSGSSPAQRCVNGSSKETT
jgi:FAD/FMN-containing dehydrogenase